MRDLSSYNYFAINIFSTFFMVGYFDCVNRFGGGIKYGIYKGYVNMILWDLKF